MGSAFRIGTVAGVPIRLHVSLLIVLPLLALLFGSRLMRAAGLAGVPPGQLGGAPWLWGLGIAVGLFAAVLIHELAHSLYALRKGGQVRDITLFFIGGVSSITRLPPGPLNEAVMALVGPLTSLAIGALLLLASSALQGEPLFNLRFAVFYLGTLNLVVGAFNLLPAFPMDGGRILRAVLMRFFGKVRATRLAAQTGKALALLLGLLALFSFNLFLAAVAFFIYLGAEAEYRQVLTEELLGPLPVSAVLDPAPEGVEESASVAEAVARLQRARALALPVTAAGTPRGVVTLEALRLVPPRRRGEVRVAAIARQVEPLAPTTRAAEAMDRMAQLALPALPVGSAGLLDGMVSGDGIARWLSLQELTPHDERPRRRGAPASALRRRESEA